jgi:CDP-diglyceride synthetase
MKTIQYDRPMEQYEVDKLIAICSGVIGGMIMFINSNFLDVTFIWSLFKATVTAFLCGLAGLAGKQFFSMIKSWYINKKNKK